MSWKEISKKLAPRLVRNAGHVGAAWGVYADSNTAVISSAVVAQIATYNAIPQIQSASRVASLERTSYDGVNDYFRYYYSNDEPNHQDGVYQAYQEFSNALTDVKNTLGGRALKTYLWSIPTILALLPLFYRLAEPPPEGEEAYSNSILFFACALTLMATFDFLVGARSEYKFEQLKEKHSELQESLKNHPDVARAKEETDLVYKRACKMVGRKEEFLKLDSLESAKQELTEDYQQAANKAAPTRFIAAQIIKVISELNSIITQFHKSQELMLNQDALGHFQ